MSTPSPRELTRLVIAAHKRSVQTFYEALRIAAGKGTKKRRAKVRLNEKAETVNIDGQDHRLNGEHAVAFVKLLLAKRGQSVKGSNIKTATDSDIRPDKVYRKLPKPLQDIISKPGRGQSGYILN